MVARKIKNYLIWLDLNLGKKLFYADQTFSRIIRGFLNLHLVKAKLGWKSFPVGDLSCKQIKEKGFLIIPRSFYPDSTVEGIRKEVQYCFDNKVGVKPRGKPGEDGEYYSYIINDVNQSVPSVSHLVPEVLQRTIEGYYGAYFEVAAVNIWRNYHVPDNVLGEMEVFSERWHCDHRQSTMFKLFYLVDDVNERQGPFHFQDKQRSRDIIRDGYKSRLIYDLKNLDIDDPDSVIGLTGNAGDVLLINTTECMHRAGVCAEGEYRDIIELQFLPSAKPLSSDWLGDALSAGLANRAK